MFYSCDFTSTARNSGVSNQDADKLRGNNKHSISSAYTGLRMMREAITIILGAKIDSAAKQRINEALEKIAEI